MEPYQKDWETVCAALLPLPDVAPGTMMRRPALRWRDTVFAFLSKLNGPGMAAKVGDTDLAALSVQDWRPLQPFKSKAPMRGWVVIGPADSPCWTDAARAALKAVGGSDA